MSQSQTPEIQQDWMVRVTPILFTLTIFLSASLLFFVQPLFTKIILPYIGGTPAVWTTAMLFFQTVLIAGYVYAHLSTKYLPVIGQLALHIVLWAAALAFLPLSIATGWSFDPDRSVATQTLILFALGVGLPFAVLSANAPLIQNWYAKSDGPSADDPYFLYGASNLGSLSALLAFPLIAEPLFGACQIGWGWAAGFVVLGLFLGLSGLAARKGKTEAQQDTTPVAAPTLKDYAFWLFLAFIPSSLMLAITTKISVDIGSFPLIWVLPLSLYLLTFVLTFTNKPLIKGEVLRWMMILGIAVLVVLMAHPTFDVSIPVIAALVLAFFFVALNAHKILYDARPDKKNLTIFYVTMSIGGALGGLFNSLIAPNIFADVHEVSITIVCATALFFVKAGPPTANGIARAVLLGALVVSPLIFGSGFAEAIEKKTLITIMSILFVIVIVVGNRNATVLVGVTSMMLLIGTLLLSATPIFKDRSFFGTHKVGDIGDYRVYMNGTTIHGVQHLEDFGIDRPRPLFYYHPDGPMGQMMTSDFGKQAADVGIVGLGVGALACFGQPGQRWQFYEIDAMVDQVARNPELFTFMSSCAAEAPTHIGDARIVLEQQMDTKYDLLVIDAYSSDAVPIHLTTNETVELYRDRLKPKGLLMMHISNRYYNISLPLGRSAADLGLQARYQFFKGNPKDKAMSPSFVVIMARDKETLAEFDGDERWKVLESDGKRVWTDDFANLLSILH